MPTSVFQVLIHVDEGASTVKDRYVPPSSDDLRGTVRGVQALLDAIGSGSVNGAVFTRLMNNGGTKAAGTIACTRANAATDTVTIEGVTLTEGTDFLRGADDNACATNLTACIEAHNILKRIVDATASTNTVTVTFKIPAVAGNALAMTTNDATAFAITAPTNGASGTVTRGYRAAHFGKGVT